MAFRFGAVSVAVLLLGSVSALVSADGLNHACAVTHMNRWNLRWWIGSCAAEPSRSLLSFLSV